MSVTMAPRHRGQAAWGLRVSCLQERSDGGEVVGATDERSGPLGKAPSPCVPGPENQLLPVEWRGAFSTEVGRGEELGRGS